MAASTAFNNIVNLVQSSNLNFKLQLSPFSANICLKKTLVKDRSGFPTLPHKTHSESTGSAEFAALAAKNLTLKSELNQKEQKIKELLEIVDNLENKNQSLENLVDNKNKEITIADKVKKEAVAKLNKKLNEVKLEFKKEKEVIMKANKTELEERKIVDVELREKLENLENENLKLKDVLYGCPECGLYSCECDDLENGENDYTHTLSTSPPSSPPEGTSLAARPLPPRPCPSSPSPWTPPPTPPCEGCGGINYGPSPGSLCTLCIPPLEIKPCSSSPSWTPPGTPPRHRLGTASMNNNNSDNHEDSMPIN